MITSDCFSTVMVDEDNTQLDSLFQKESIVDVEIPVRGLLIKESVVVCNCSQDQIEAQSSNISHFCTGAFNYPLFIKMGRTNKSLMCRLSDLLVYSGKLVLSDFRVMDQAWTDREFERVQPKQPTFVTLVWKNSKIKTNLFDLSQTGMCVLVEKAAIIDQDQLIGSDVQILMNLPVKNDELCKIKGHIVQNRSISKNLLRLGLDISMSKKDGEKIAHYLSDRKREILDELFLNFLELLNYRDTKDMYF
jgi:hypothetical protein